MWWLLVYANHYKEKFTFFSSSIKIREFWRERKFWRQKNQLVSKEELYSTKNSFKYFVGYSDNDVIRPLCIKLPQMIGYIRKFEGNTTCLLRLVTANC